MIVRQAVMRQGRRLVAPSRRTINRAFATRVDRITSLELAVDNHSKETLSIVSQLQDFTTIPIPSSPPVLNLTSVFYTKRNSSGEWIPREREYAVETQEIEARAGDWLCRPCGEHNYAYMTDRCVNCKAEKEAEHTFPEADHVRIEVKRKISELPKQKTAKANLAQTAKKTARSNPAATRSIAAQEAAFRHAENVTLPIGSTLTPHYQPNQLVFNPPSPSEVTLELLMASQAHLGHATSRWNPMNSRYIYGERQGVHIISLDQTASHLRRACRIVSGVTERGGLVLFVGTRPGQDLAVIEAATNAGGCHLFEKWKPGSITNSNQILRECEVKAVDDFDREIKGYEDELMELAALKPDLVVCLNPLENWVLLHECGQFNVPTIGIIDTDADPTWVTYPIPANDDSIRAIQVIAGALGMAGKEGKQARLAKAVNGSDLEYATVDMEKLRKDMAIPERRA